MNKIVFLFFVHLILINSLQAIERYQLIDLGLLDYESSEVTSINKQGQICGIYTDKNKNYIFIWDSTNFEFNYSKIHTSVKPFINQKPAVFSSQFLQITNDFWDFEQEAIFCWENPFSFFTFLNVRGLGFPKEAAKDSPFEDKRTILWDVNDHDELLIMNHDSLKDFLLGNPLGFKYQVWIYQNQKYQLLSDPQFCVGLSLNNRSEVLGYYYQQIDIYHNTQKIFTAIYDTKTQTIRTLEFPPNAIGKAFNDLGDVVGIFYHPLTQVLCGFLTYECGEYLILDNFYPIKNNNKNLVIGKFIEGENKDKPAIWEEGYCYHLLDYTHLIDDKGHVWDSLEELLSINDDGLIIGRGKINGKEHGFLLQPIK